MAPRQLQTAGAQSQQIQVSGDLVVVEGVTEQRAIEIADQRAREVLAEYTAEAKPVAEGRVDSFDLKLVTALAEDGLLDALGDPAFQVLLRKAQFGAASTERENDHDLLVRLLAERAQRSGRRVRASIDRAVQIIDQIDDSALQALTIFWAITTLTPQSGLIRAGLDTMESVFLQIGTDDLPSGEWWLDHLETLDAMRSGVRGVSTLKKMREYFPPKVSGYLTPGFDMNVGSAINIAIKQITGGVGIDIVRHELKDEETYRCAVVSLSMLSTAVRSAGYSPEQEEEVVGVVSSQGLVGQVDAGCTDKLVEEIDRRQSFGALHTWWDGIPTALTITDVGRAVALSNAKRVVDASLLPPLELGT